MDTWIGMNQLRPGEQGTVTAVHTSGDMRRRLLDIGFIENTPIMCVGRSPSGDPAAFLIRGAVIALREEDSRCILVRRI